MNADKIETTFKHGVVTVTRPKTGETKKPAKTINLKAA